MPNEFGAEYLEESESTFHGNGVTPVCQYNSSTGVLWCQYRYKMDM